MFTAHTSAGIDYRERPGTGPALVLLHGIGSNADS
jgi:pimeloyl-ACP methyl ester carboxylesterase